MTRRLRPALCAAALTLTTGLLAGCQTTDGVGPATSAPNATQSSETASGSSTSSTDAARAATTHPSSTSAEGTASSQATSTTTPTSSSVTSGAPATTAGAVAAAGALYQVASIVDGDTIKVWIDGTRTTVRLLGIDTPETVKPGFAQGCYGKQATSKMQSLVQSQQVHLVGDATQGDKDRHGRLLRYVMLPDGRDVSHQLIVGGFGREYTYAAAYAKQGAFRAAQSTAQAAKSGLWGACTYDSAFNPPATTGAAPTTPNPPAVVAPSPTRTQPPAPAGACNIKGNINSKGEKIYHRPGQQAYDKTVITPSKGERMFCSAAEAEAAGWRAAKR